MLSDEEQDRLKVILRETEERFRDVEAQNRQLRSELDQRENYQSAFTSNNRAYTEKLDRMQSEVREKEEVIRRLESDQQAQGDENRTLRDENSLYRGRCANLQRDIEMQGGAMSKLGSDAGTLGEQLDLYKNRASQLEQELARVSEERTDYIFDVKRLTAEKEKLEGALQKVQTESVRA